MDIADDATLGAQLSAIGRVDVTGDGAVDGDRRGLNVCFNDAVTLDDDVLAQADLALDGPEDDQVLVAGDFAVDDDGAAYDGVSHGEGCSNCSGASG